MYTLFRNLLITTAVAVGAQVASADSILSIRDTITDPNMVYPHSFEADTHRLMQNWYMQNYVVLQREGETSGPVVEATDEEMKDRLMAMPTVIEMPFNSVVKSYIQLYVERRRSLVENMLGMSTYYMPIFEQALESEGMPLELKYLSIVESALNPTAVSRAGAAGLWQFMPATARGLGLEINSLVDERRDPVLSSKMAARYLHQLYDIYNDWSLAIAAYNCGPGNVNKALRRAGNEGKKDFWAIYAFLPAETRGYVPCFIAANYAMTYYDKHNISPALARRPIITDSVHVTKRVHFQQISDVLNIPIDEIRLLNPMFRKDVIPGDVKPYPLVLPSHQALSYIISEDSIVAHDAAKYARRGVVEPSTGTTQVTEDGKYIITEEVKFHKVRKGETLSGLAKKYGVTVSSIKKANGGIKTLRRGRTIKIIITKRTLKPEEPVEPETTEPKDTIVTPTATSPDSIAPVDSILSTPVINAADTTVVVAADGAVELDDEDMPEENEIEERIAADDDEDAQTSPAVVVSQAEEAATENNDTIAEGAAAAARVESTFNNRQSSSTVAESGNSDEAKASKADKAKKENKQKPVYHKVRKGETLSKIAKRYGTTVKKIQKLNNMSNTRITAGKRIRVK